MHLFIKPVSSAVCPQCKKPLLPHTACLNCGYYKGREVLDILGKLTKKERKAKEKEMKQAEKEQKQDKPITMEELSKK